MSDRPIPPAEPFEDDSFLARALQSIPVPHHRQGFWSELDARLAVVDAERAGRRHGGTRPRAAAEEVSTDADADDLPIAEPLAGVSRRQRLLRRRGPLVAAAVLVLVTAAGTALYLNRPDDRDLQPAGVPGTTTAVTPAPTTVAPTPPVAELSPEAAAVRDFVHAIGANSEGAFAMLTAESRESYSNPTQLAEGFSQSLGAWAAPGAIEQEYLMQARSPANVEAAVVTYAGNVDVDGRPRPAAQAFAVVREDGAWRISLTGIIIAASAGPGIEMVVPAVEPALECCGIGGSVGRGEPIRFELAVATEVEFITVAFDGDDPLDPAQLELADSMVTARPQLETGSHVVTIAVVLPGGTLFARAVQFVVE
jgi:hypothetical protein